VSAEQNIDAARSLWCVVEIARVVGPVFELIADEDGGEPCTSEEVVSKIGL